MGFGNRVRALLGKGPRTSDPHQVLEGAANQQGAMLQRMRAALVDLGTARKRLEMSMHDLQAQVAELEESARGRVAAGDDDGARAILARKATLAAELADLARQRDDLAAQEASLDGEHERLQAKLAAFRTRTEAVQASTTAAEARARFGEAEAGFSRELGDVGQAMRQAEDQSAALQARAEAVDEVLAGRADPQTQLEQVASSSSVEADLAKLKKEAGR